MLHRYYGNQKVEKSEKISRRTESGQWNS